MDVTLHETGGHNTWTSAQRDDHIIEWLLRQRRGRFAFPRDVPFLGRSRKEIFLLFVLPIVAFVSFATASLRISRRQSKTEPKSSEPFSNQALP